MSKDLPTTKADPPDPPIASSPIGDLAFHFGQFFPNCRMLQLFYLSVRGKKHIITSICFRCFSELFKTSKHEFGDTKYSGLSSCCTALSLQQSKGVSIQIIIDIVFLSQGCFFVPHPFLVCGQTRSFSFGTGSVQNSLLACWTKRSCMCSSKTPPCSSELWIGWLLER